MMVIDADMREKVGQGQDQADLDKKTQKSRTYKETSFIVIAFIGDLVV